MALIKCPECGREVSNKAPACIHCGYPLQESQPQEIIWNGKDGAYKLEDGFPPENIPMFIAANTKLDYTNSLIELLYKDNQYTTSKPLIIFAI